MALPLLWLGAAAVSAIAAKTLADDRKEQQRQRGFSYKPTKLSELPEHDSSVAIYPTDVFKTYQKQNLYLAHWCVVELVGYWTTLVYGWVKTPLLNLTAMA